MSANLRSMEAPLDEEYWQALLRQEEQAPPAPEVGASGSWPAGPVLGEGAIAGPAHEMDRASQVPDGPSDDGRDEEWRWLDELYDTQDIIDARVVGCNKGGLLVRFGGYLGFVPASQLANVPECLGTDELRSELEQMVGQEIQVKLIEVDRERNRIIGSERATAWSEGEIRARLNGLEPGQVVRGTIRSLCEFGAFVDLGGIDGLVHISELSWERVEHPQDVFDVGEEVEVYVLNVDPDERRIGLSRKRLQPDPWQLVAERYCVGDVVNVVVTNVVDFGAFARVAEGVEGLIHISELAEGHFLHPRNVVEEGDELEARILNIDADGRRLGLSLRQL
jgi:small subunit ribosomal protein S1